MLNTILFHLNAKPNKHLVTVCFLSNFNPSFYYILQSGFKIHNFIIVFVIIIIFTIRNRLLLRQIFISINKKYFPRNRLKILTELLKFKF